MHWPSIEVGYYWNSMDSEMAYQKANVILSTPCHNATQRCPHLHFARDIIMIPQSLCSGKQRTQLRAENVVKSHVFILCVVGLSWSGMIRCPTYTLFALRKKDPLQTSLMMKLYRLSGREKEWDKGRVENDAWHLASHDGAKPLSLDLHDVPHGPVNMCPPPWHHDMLRCKIRLELDNSDTYDKCKTRHWDISSEGFR